MNGLFRLVFFASCFTLASANLGFCELAITWERLADAPTGRGGAGGAAIIDNMLYIVGGHEGSPGSCRVHEAYDIDSNTWSSTPIEIAKVLAPDGAIDLRTGETKVLDWSLR